MMKSYMKIRTTLSSLTSSFRTKDVACQRRLAIEMRMSSTSFRWLPTTTAATAASSSSSSSSPSLRPLLTPKRTRSSRSSGGWRSPFPARMMEGRWRSTLDSLRMGCGCGATFDFSPLFSAADDGDSDDDEGRHRFLDNLHDTLLTDRIEEEASGSCSPVKRAFSSMVLMIQEVQSHTLAWHLRQEPVEVEVEGIHSRVHGEINASLCWLFLHIYSSTPSLMLSLMLLLSNFVADHFALALSSPTSTSNAMTKMRGTPPRRRGGDSIVAALEEEATLWKGIVEEATRMQAETRHPDLMDHQTLLGFVSPVTVEAEPDRDYPEYLHTDLMYQMALNHEPHNPMLLSNYAHFLYQVVHDLPRAEYYFKRAAETRLADAEALSRYAQFLWLGKEDLGAAEEMYLQAIDADPSNPAHHSNYAHFLWRTGGEDTCYPLDDDHQSTTPNDA